MTETQLLARTIEAVCAEFDAHAHVVDTRTGPVVNTYLLQPGHGVRVSKLARLESDLALRLGADAVRIVDAPGLPYLALEVPRTKRDVVPMVAAKSDAALPLVLGVSTLGEPVEVDLAKAPHLLVAGQTGSGKSVAVHAMLCGLLERHTARADLRLLLIDPKMLEFVCYRDEPQLLTRVLTETRDAVMALNTLVSTMEGRYRVLAAAGCRDIGEYRATGRNMPYVVCVIDEWADLFLTAGKGAEVAVVRLAQKARAAGIHLILATQRPSVKVISGIIKANFPARLALRVTTNTDSRVVLDTPGAECLLGRGDALVSGFGEPKPVRVHGPLVDPETWLERNRQ